jgi:hypothetical protein
VAQAPVVTMPHSPQQGPYFTIRVLHCTEVSQQTVEMGHSGRFGDVGCMSAYPPIATEMVCR